RSVVGFTPEETYFCNIHNHNEATKHNLSTKIKKMSTKQVQLPVWRAESSVPLLVCVGNAYEYEFEFEFEFVCVCGY
ncbi:hypothetical protein DKP78_20775, partial [Enterococcus faecium]